MIRTRWDRIMNTRRHAPRRTAAALGASLIVHAALLLALVWTTRGVDLPAQKTASLVLVTLPRLGDDTARAPEQRDPGAARDKPARAPRPDKPQPSTPARATPRNAPTTINEIAALVKLAEAAHDPSAAQPNRRPQNAPTSAAVGPVATDVSGGDQGLDGLKDFLRAQIERRWEFDVARLGHIDDVVSIRIVLGRDGTVLSASVVADPRHRDDTDLAELARSARNAVIVSSPLRLPPRMPDTFRDVVLNFRPRDVTR